MRTLVLDSGAFIAAERNNVKFLAIARSADAVGSVVLVPATVLAEIWRDPPRHRSAKLLDAASSAVPLGHSDAQEVGRLLGLSGSVQIVDANLALTALEARPSMVLTSDPDDIVHLVRAAGGTCSVGGKGSPNVDVVIESV